jgi:HJR/Mrr/RecB family endonuclease
MHGTLCFGDLIARSPDGLRWAVERKRKTKNVNGKYEFEVLDAIEHYDGGVLSVIARLRQIGGQ